MNDFVRMVGRCVAYYRAFFWQKRLRHHRVQQAFNEAFFIASGDYDRVGIRLFRQARLGKSNCPELRQACNTEQAASDFRSGLPADRLPREVGSCVADCAKQFLQ